MKEFWSRRVIVAAHDLAMVGVAWLGAYWLRFNLETIPSAFLDTGLKVLPLLFVVQGGAFWLFGLYRGIWRFASLPDLARIGKSVVVGALVGAMAVFFWTRMQGIPRSVFPLYVLLLAFLVGGPRLLYRWVKDQRLPLSQGTRVLIVGAGSGGEMLARDLLRASATQYAPIGFVDDDPKKHGKEIHGFRVLGPVDSIPQLVEPYAIDLAIVAIPSARSKNMRRIVRICEDAGIQFRTLPSIDDIATGRTAVNALKEVSIDDLLGREPVLLDWDSIEAGLANRTVMVTGGGGSIGSELCRQIARVNPKRLIVFESGEFNLFEIERELRQVYPNIGISAYLGDVTDVRAVEDAFGKYQPHVVFHAAAYKHVPMLEGMVRSAVRNNVLGTVTVADAADRFGVTKFVLISTDKAVNPTNVMGATKRVAEMFCQNLGARSGTSFITVRFGNVLGSAGSVVPIFREQIKRGGPVTVTHPEVTRFFMTIPEACQLIMQAGVMGQGGEIFVLDMGEPVKIAYLADQMIRLAGKTPGDDIDICFTGLRPGEKLYEELFHDQEPLVGTGHEKILLAHARQIPWDDLTAQLRNLQSGVTHCEEAQLLSALHRLVPEYEPARPLGSSQKVIPIDNARK